MSDLSRMTLKELGKLLLYSACMLAMMQFTFRSLRLGEYTDFCMNVLGMIGWTIIYYKYTNGLRNKYKKSPTPPPPKGRSHNAARGKGES